MWCENGNEFGDEILNANTVDGLLGFYVHTEHKEDNLKWKVINYNSWGLSYWYFSRSV